jgi:hypothetical protein
VDRQKGILWAWRTDLKDWVESKTAADNLLQNAWNGRRMRRLSSIQLMALRKYQKAEIE